MRRDPPDERLAAQSRRAGCGGRGRGGDRGGRLRRSLPGCQRVPLAARRLQRRAQLLRRLLAALLRRQQRAQEPLVLEQVGRRRPLAAQRLWDNMSRTCLGHVVDMSWTPQPLAARRLDSLPDLLESGKLLNGQVQGGEVR